MAIADKHILILTPGFPKDEDDSTCIPPLQEFLIEFKSVYPSVIISIISFQYPYRNKPYFWNGLKIIPLGGRNSTIKKPFVWLNAIRESTRVYKSYKIDTIHSLWLGECPMIGNIISKRFGCQHICTLMGQDVKASNKYLKWLKSSSIKFIAISKNQSEEFQNLSTRKPDEIIHWGIDDRSESKPERDIDLLGVGSLIPLKNYSLFIQLVGEISKTNQNIKCKLVGEGPELNKLKALAKAIGEEKNIEFTGLLSRQRVLELMQRSKILIHPSKFESAGFVFTEALLNGMNIVSFNVGYAQEHPKWSIAGDEKDFVDNTIRLLSSKLDFNSVNLFPLKETVKRYTSLYGIQ